MFLALKLIACACLQFLKAAGKEKVGEALEDTAHETTANETSISTSILVDRTQDMLSSQRAEVTSLVFCCAAQLL